MKYQFCACALAIVVASACSANSGSDPSTPSGSGSGASTGSGSGGTGIQTGSGGSGTGTGGTIGIGTSGGTGGTSDVANGECDQVNFESQRKPVEVLLVLDRSGSMTEHYPPGSDPSLDQNGDAKVDRWELLTPSVNAALIASDANIAWGLKLFPTGVDTSCSASTITSTIEIPIAAMNATTITGLVDTTAADGNGTPTGQAIQAGAAYLATLPAGVDRYMLLATDGDPSCPDDSSGETLALQELTAAYNAGYPTFVVGVIDEGDNREKLNAMAVAGGVPRPLANPLADKFYLASTQQALVDALASITGQIPSCVFQFDSAPPDPTNIAVKVNGEKVVQDTTHTEGWDYTSEDHLGVELYGATCETVKDASANTIDMIFGCPGVPIK